MAAPEPTLPPQGVAVTVSGSGQRFVHKKKKVLNAEESELYELAQAAGVGLDPELFRILLDLLKMNVAPLAVFQMLKSMCAGHRAAEATSTESHSTMVPANLPEARGRNKPHSSGSGALVPTERGSREGSSQRVPRQPSASRLQQKGVGVGKSS
ncbi:mitotic-spindle organizing protein 2B-like isoform X2 [Ambystoma mexicanum]|uniref:mitotic-spindle organizing protein 2B-like isoform X2 n=1 Tax=Ambystoma mexicanum TaxID=8296 RepID=UPI0037E9ACB6